MFIQAETLDDLLRRAIDRIQRQGDVVTGSRRGPNRELRGVLLKLKNPLARLSTTEKKGKVFSALGEFAWYLNGSDSADFITYYIKKYEEEREDDGTIHGAYGPRIFGGGGASQFDTVAGLLTSRPSTKHAVIQLFDSDDLRGVYKDVPCTCTLQFLLRSGRLEMVTTMRSNDAFFGLPHDVFSFTMLQELLARRLGCGLGTYSHFVGSLHLYDEYASRVRRYMGEGWQDTVGVTMPPMPPGDQRPHIQTWLEAEAAVRAGREPGKRRMSRLPEYWQDLVRLLQVYRCTKGPAKRRITRLKGELAFPIYRQYISMREPPKRSAPRSGQPELFDTTDQDESED